MPPPGGVIVVWMMPTGLAFGTNAPDVCSPEMGLRRASVAAAAAASVPRPDTKSRRFMWPSVERVSAARRKHALQRNVEKQRQVRLHVVMGLAAARGRERIRRHRDEIARHAIEIDSVAHGEQLPGPGDADLLLEAQLRGERHRMRVRRDLAFKQRDRFAAAGFAT